MQNWGTPTRLLEDVFDGYGYHSTVLQLNNQNYLAWVHQANTSSKSIYIAAMRNPTEVIQPAVLLKKPEQAWECYISCALEFPSILYHKDSAFLVFSASGYDNNPDLSLSYMRIDNGKDPLDIFNWYMVPGPVFTRNDAENVYATGRAWFTSSPNGLEDWMLYMASANATSINSSRSIRIQKLTWNEETGHPIFPKAHGFSYSLAIPSSFEYFTNPVTENTAVSPGAIRIGNFYYMLLSAVGGSEIEILKSGRLENFRNAERKILFSVPDGFSISGSSKIHEINDQLYIYFSMEGQNSTSKMFALQALDSSNPMGVWDTSPTQLATSWNFSAVQGTILKHNGSLFLVWITPHPATGYNSIFIAEMENATYAVEPFNQIRSPIELWECDGGCSNEAPFFLYNEETAYLVHSVGSACNGGNGLTYMSIGESEDPMNVVNWNKAPDKVFSENSDESVFCPAHASFTVSPDGKETWMVYHATDSSHPDAVKTARIEKILWDSESGAPVFSEPHGLHHQQIVPMRK